jgi:hypothetical protein
MNIILNMLMKYSTSIPISHTRDGSEGVDKRPVAAALCPPVVIYRRAVRVERRASPSRS